MVWLMHLAAIVGFLAFGGISYWSWSEAKSQESYVPVEATILDSRVEESRSSRSSGSSGSRTSTTMYGAEVRYTYEVGGQRYESDAIGLVSGRSGDPSNARKKVAKYPKGSKVTAYVNPDDNEDAVLEKGVSPWLTAAFAAAAAFALALASFSAMISLKAAQPDNLSSPNFSMSASTSRLSTQRFLCRAFQT